MRCTARAPMRNYAARLDLQSGAVRWRGGGAQPCAHAVRPPGRSSRLAVSAEVVKTTRKVEVLKQFPVQLPRPLGIVFAEKKNGDIRVDELVDGGNAATSGKLLLGDKLVKCGPTADALVDCEGLGFDGVLDVLGGSPDSDVMTVVVERLVEQVEEIEEDFSDAAAYWKRKRELKAMGGRRVSDMRRTGGLMPGDIVVDRQIGGGSFGGVFAGSWNGMQVILKRANAQVFGAEELLELEMQLNDVVLAKSPGSCAAYVGCCEVAEVEGRPIYEKKLPEGLWLVWRNDGEKTLQSLMPAPKPLSKAHELGALAEALGCSGGNTQLTCTQVVVKQLLEGLRDLHAIKVVHRDIKPANLVLVESERRLKLIDLGAAADFGGTALGVKLGDGPHDPLYCPPNRKLLPEDAEAVSPESLEALWSDHAPALFDMHAVGVVMMQLACAPLRREENLTTFRAQLAAGGDCLNAWRASSSAFVKDANTVLDHSDGAGWELAAQLLTPRGDGGAGGPPHAAEALKHRFF